MTKRLAGRRRTTTRSNATSTKRTNYPDRIYGPVRTRALLVVHLLAIGEKKRRSTRKKSPWWPGASAFRRPVGRKKKVEYVVNTTWDRERYPEDDDEEEEDAGDGE